MDYDVSVTSNNSCSLAVNKKGFLITENAATQTTFLNRSLEYFIFLY